MCVKCKFCGNPETYHIINTGHPDKHKLLTHHAYVCNDCGRITLTKMKKPIKRIK